MKLFKPNFWTKKISFFSILLWPLSIIYQFFIYVKNLITKERVFKIPIICVGNIYLGGTGKTPMALFLAKIFESRGKKTSIVKKYYPEHFDEHLMIKNYTNNLFLDKNRQVAMQNVEKNNFDLAILDDGFQDKSIKKNFNILCFNSNQLIGNGFVFPAGPLRERLSSIKGANVIVVNGKKDDSFEKKINDISKNIEIFYSNYEPINIKEFKNKKIFAFAGIGNPDNFFKMLIENDIDLQKKIAFPDHYELSKDEIKKIIKEASEKKLDILTSEKDFYRLKKYNIKEISHIKIRLKITDEKKFLEKVNNFIC
tara:strand:+ start:587 stop:1519 length:933 start_codon:yes stop_codon:yes gene_type:complete